MSGFGFHPLRSLKCKNCDTKLQRVYERVHINRKTKFRHVLGEYRCPNCRAYYSRVKDVEQNYYQKGDINDPYYP